MGCNHDNQKLQVNAPVGQPRTFLRVFQFAAGDNSAGNTVMGTCVELRQLRYLVVLSEELHFARAAERLHIEQPPLSRSIKMLEDELQAPLFTRGPRGTKLTAAGAVAVEHARPILDLVEQLKGSVRSAHGQASQSLRIGLVDSFGQPQLPGVLSALQSEGSPVEAALFELPFPQQLQGLREGQLDLCLNWDAQPGEGIASEPLWYEELIAVVPAQHPLAQRGSASLRSIAAETLIVAKPDWDGGSTAQFKALLQPHAAAPVRVAELLSSMGMMAPMVAMGHGVGLALATSAEGLRQPGVVVLPLEEQAVLTTYLLRMNDAKAPAVERFKRCAHRVAPRSSVCA